MKLCVVIPNLNQRELTRTCYEEIRKNTDFLDDVEFLMIDNGSDEPLEESDVLGARVVRHDESIGVYPIFWDALQHTDADLLAFLHSDVVIWGRDWNDRVLGLFNGNPNLGLVGFVGSNEIDGSGGRGLGTASNFMGLSLQSPRTGQVWTGSEAKIHGAKITGAVPAAVEDGCVMIFRRSVLEEIPQRMDFPPHHFYDRLLSCETRERGYEMMTLGIAFDHFSGQTVNHESKYQSLAQRWCEARGIPMAHNWDHAIYVTAEKMWLNEYRDQKHLVPVKI